MGRQMAWRTQSKVRFSHGNDLLAVARTPLLAKAGRLALFKRAG